jgi:uncharacterized membrane protein SpoIIM required for sporulation
MALASRVTEAAFVRSRQDEWNTLGMLTRIASERGIKRLSPDDLGRLSPLYRDICADLARAQASRYSAPLVDYLQTLTASAHTAIYTAPRSTRSRFYDALVAFPRAVRRRKVAVALAAALFFVPLLFGVVMTLRDPTFAFKVAPEAMLRPLTEAYRKGFSEGREAGQGAMMAGFYVNNNVGIALRCFALGIFGGLGSAFYLFENGLVIGSVLGYVASQGAGDNIVTFIVGHGSFELGAIVLAGAAGMSMGWSMVAPGQKTRLKALQDTAKDVVVIVAGAAVMLLIAASLEAFWSGSSVPDVVKRTFGLIMFLLVVSYLTFVGRGKQEHA